MAWQVRPAASGAARLVLGLVRITRGAVTLVLPIVVVAALAFAGQAVSMPARPASPVPSSRFRLTHLPRLCCPLLPLPSKRP
jgi:hypothetical protein